MINVGTLYIAYIILHVCYMLLNIGTAIGAGRYVCTTVIKV